MTRRSEVLVATIAILAAAAFTTAVLIWHYGFDDAWWSLSLPDAGDWNGFELYAWAEVILLIAFVVIWLITALLIAMRRRRAGASVLIWALPFIVAFGALTAFVILSKSRRGHIEDWPCSWR
jgi:hypothetical protein